jgi:ABC-2 type transport system ATP-binding protein
MGEIALRIEKLNKWFRSNFLFKKIIALENLNIEIKKNEIFGFLGPNGAGKSTTIKCVLGLIKPNSGKIEIMDSKITNRATRKKIGFLPENPYFYDYLTGREFLHFCGKLFKIESKKRKELIESLLEKMSLSKSADLQLRKYSKGMKQRIGFAQAMINDPDIYFLDEPMSGLDPLGRRLIRNCIHELKERGKTVFLNTHIMSDVEMICDRLGILINGKLIKIGTLDELLGNSVEMFEMIVNVDEFTKNLLNSISIKIMQKGDKQFVYVDSEYKMSQALTIVGENKGKVHAIIPIRKTLEDFFMEEIRKTQNSEKYIDDSF